MTVAADPTAELASFLRSRRERLDPDDFRLPARRRSRRTPGLRREEVAELAGVSIDYVVRLEQGRGLRPSAEVIEGLARALRLAPPERAYLFDLTGHRPQRREKPPTTAEPALATLIDDLSPLPAILMNHRYDVLAWNGEAIKLIWDFAALPPQQRNSMWLCLMHPEIREYYPDREAVVRDGIACLRAAWAAHPDDAVLLELIDELIQDEDVARFWDERDVQLKARGTKTFHHPEAGLLSVDFETLSPLQDPDQLVVIHRASDAASQTALDRLFA